MDAATQAGAAEGAPSSISEAEASQPKEEGMVMKRRSFLRLLGSTALAAWVGPVQLGEDAIDELKRSREGMSDRDRWEAFKQTLKPYPTSGETQMSTPETDPVITMSVVYTDEVQMWSIVTDA